MEEIEKPSANEFQKLSFSEHVRKRAMWGGSTVVGKHMNWVYRGGKFVRAELCYGEAMLDCFDEILVNAIDHYMKKIDSGCGVSEIKIGYNTTTGICYVENDGPGIPITTEWGDGKSGIYIPQAIVTEERFGSNFDDEKDPDRITGGLNGLGAKITNIYSKKFMIETVDIERKLVYKQVFADGVPGKPVIREMTGYDHAHTIIKFLPDYANLCKTEGKVADGEWIKKNPKVMGELILMRAFHTAVFVSSIEYRYSKGKRIEYPKNKRASVYFNNKLIPVKSFADYLKLFGLSKAIFIRFADESIKFPWYIGIGLTKELNLDENYQECISIVNGVHVSGGGDHVNMIMSQISEKLFAKIPKNMTSDEKMEASFKTAIRHKIEQGLFCYFDCKQFPFTTMDFKGQTKDQVKIGRATLNEMKKIYDVEPYIGKLWKLAKEQIQDMIELRNFTKQTASAKSKGPIRKYDRATEAGKRDKLKCSLFIPEGDSANKPIRTIISSGHVISNKYYGTYNIQGVPPNARKMIRLVQNNGRECPIANAQLRDNIAFKGLVNALNLNYAFTYELTPAGNKEFGTLAYGSIVITTDQDLDGIGHICSLITVFIMCFWPALIKRGFVKRLQTPIIRVYHGGVADNYYSQGEYDAWVSKNFGAESNLPSSHKVQYYKGLSTHSKDEVLYDIGSNILQNIKTFEWDEACIKVMNWYYDKETNKRKELLKTPVSEKYTEAEIHGKSVALSKHYNIETKSFKLETLQRKLISALDGMVPSQKMAFMAGREKKKKIKTMALTGFVTENFYYEHGDASMNGVISKMAQTMIGGNNIPPFLPVSDGFGSRKLGREHNGEARYTFVKYNARVMDLLFPREDDLLLEYTYIEGKRSAPKYLVPIMPYAILESITSPASGWKLEVWARQWKYVLFNVKQLIKGAENLIIKLGGHPWVSDKMTVIIDDKGREVCLGAYTLDEGTETITITELPLRVWSESVKNKLLGIKSSEAKSAKNGKDTGKKAKADLSNAHEYIKEVDDDTGENVRLIVQLVPGSLEKIRAEYKEGTTDDPIANFLGLHKYMPHALNMIAKDGTVSEFKNYEDIIEYWFPIRRDLYIERIKRLTILLECRLVFYQQKLRFIIEDGGEPKQIDIDKKPGAEQEKILAAHKYRRINHVHLAQPEYTKSDDLSKYIFEIGASYKYIYNITVGEKSEESITDIKKKIADIESELAKLAESTWAELWLSELEELNKVVKEGIISDWNYGKPPVEFNNSSAKKSANRAKKVREPAYAKLLLPD